MTKSLLDCIVPEFKNMKFRVKDEEHSKQIQEYLFSLRYRWLGRYRDTMHVNKPYLFTQTDGRITQTDNEYGFNDPDYIEYQLKETKTYSLEEVKPFKSIVSLGVDLNVDVTVNGEKISLKDLKELLSKG